MIEWNDVGIKTPEDLLEAIRNKEDGYNAGQVLAKYIPAMAFCAVGLAKEKIEKLQQYILDNDICICDSQYQYTCEKCEILGGE